MGRIKRHLCGLLRLVVFCGGLFSVVSWSQTTQLTAMQLQPVPDKNNQYVLSLSFNQAITHKAFLLTHPDRLVIDFPEALFQVKKPLPQLASSPIKDFRHGIQDGVNLRLVFDLQMPFNFISSTVAATNSQPFQIKFLLTSQVLPGQVADKIKNEKNVPNNPDKIPSAQTSVNKMLQRNASISRHTIIEDSAVDAQIDSLVNTSVSSAEKNLLVHQSSITSSAVTDKKSNANNNVATTLATSTNKSPSPPFLSVAIPENKPHPFVVVIDAGHGGKDPGTMGKDGVREKNITLAIAKDLQQLIEQQPGMTAFLTRSGDYYVGLRQRLMLAHKAHGDVFIAIHADAYKNTDATGASIFALSPHGASSESALWLAQRENYSELGGINLNGIDTQDNQLRSILIDLSQTATINSSLQLGNKILSQLNDVTNLHHTIVEQAPFMVLKSPDIPSILVETGFLSNPQEESRLNTIAYQEKIAHALFDGIKKYYLDYAMRNLRVVRMSSIS